MSDRVVLVTGASGFIGTWVLREVLRGEDQVIALDLQPGTARWTRVLGASASEVTFSFVSLTDRAGIEELLRKHQVTQIIHLAALLTPECQLDPCRGCEVNVLGSTALFEAARRAGCVQAISYASSYAVYGDLPTTEDQDASEPPMFYGAFKQAFDLIAKQFWKHFGLRSIAIRPHVVYGPEREFGISAGPSVACRAAIHGERYNIGFTGRVGYDYVEDVARAFVLGAYKCPPGATIIDLPSEPATPEEIVRLIEQYVPEGRGLITVSGPAIPPNIPPFPKDIRRIIPTWQATPLTVGVARTLDYYRSLVAQQ